MIDVAAVDLVLSTTRSVRRRLDFGRPVPAAVIEECIAVSTQAPTGLFRESWRFVVVRDPARKADIAEHYRSAFDELVDTRLVAAREAGHDVPEPRPTYRMLADRIQDFPALILVCSEGRPEPADPTVQLAFYGSVLPAAWSLMLALRARGIGSTWTTLLAQRERAVAAALGIPDDVTLTVMLPVGYLKDAVLRPASRRPPHEVTYWDTWGEPREA
jgi:nitroreductase